MTKKAFSRTPSIQLCEQMSVYWALTVNILDIILSYFHGLPRVILTTPSEVNVIMSLMLKTLCSERSINLPRITQMESGKAGSLSTGPLLSQMLWASWVYSPSHLVWIFEIRSKTTHFSQRQIITKRRKKFESTLNDPTFSFMNKIAHPEGRGVPWQARPGRVGEFNPILWVW